MSFADVSSLELAVLEDPKLCMSLQSPPALTPAPLEPSRAMDATDPAAFSMPLPSQSLEHAATELEDSTMKLQPPSAAAEGPRETVALEDAGGWCSRPGVAQDPELALTPLSSRQSQADAIPWYASKQVLLTLGGYGLVSS